MGHSCSTRALKNARRIQSLAPRLLQDNPLPLAVLSRIHKMSDAEIAAVFTATNGPEARLLL